jgi:flavin-binding protein dodecin
MNADDREWFEGKSKTSFADAARDAVERAEEAFRERGEELPTEYDVRLRVTAEGVISDYKALVSPGG